MDFNQQVYDTILDALDSENTELLKELFIDYGLEPYSELF